MKTMISFFKTLGITRRQLATRALVCAACMATAPVHADALFYGVIYEQVTPTINSLLLNFYETRQAGGTTFNWSGSCSQCGGGDVSATGAATITGGILGAEGTETLSGSPYLIGGPTTTPAFVSVNTHVSYNDALTVTGGTGSAVLGLQYSLDGTLNASDGRGAIIQFGLSPNNLPNGTEVSLNAPSLSVYDGAGNKIGSLGVLTEASSGDSINDTLSIYVPITYGTPVSIEPVLVAWTSYAYGQPTPFTATSDFYNTMTLDSALVFSGTPDDLGSINTDAVISASSGLDYGPDGFTAVPEPGTLALFGFGLGLVALSLSRRKLWFAT